MRKLRCRSAAARCPAGTGRRRRRARPRSSSSSGRSRATAPCRRDPTDEASAEVRDVCRSRARLAAARARRRRRRARRGARRRCADRASAPGRSSSVRARPTCRTGHVGYSCVADQRVLERLEEAARAAAAGRRASRSPGTIAAAGTPCGAQLAAAASSARARRAPRGALVGRHRIAAAVDRDPRVVALHAVHAARAAPVEQRAVDRVADHLLGGHRGRDLDAAAPRRAAPRRCGRGARARRRSRARRACRPSGRPDRRG